MGIKINELSESTDVLNGTYLVIDNGVKTTKISKENLLKDMGYIIKPSGSDDTQSLKDAIETYSNIILTEGEYNLSDTLRLKKGTKISGVNRQKTVLKFTTNVNCVNINGNSEISNLSIEVPNGYSQNCINCQSWEMSSVDNGKVSNINIRQTIVNTSALGNAINLEASSTLGTQIYFTNFLFENIDIKGFWDNGINATIHYVSDNDSTWLTVMKFQNIFVNTSRNTVNFNYTNNNNLQLTFPRNNSFADFSFKNVSTQFISGKTERFLILSNVVRSKFDMCIPWDWNARATVAGQKPYVIHCDNDVRVAINDIMYTTRPYDVIDFVNGEEDNLVNMRNHLTSYTTIDGKNTFVSRNLPNTFSNENTFEAPITCNAITSNEYISSKKYRVSRETDPDNMDLAMMSLKPIYYLSSETTSSLETHFIGFHFDSNNTLGGETKVYSFELGLDGGNKLVYRAKGTNEWKGFYKLITENYFPHGNTASRPTNPSTGFMYFDTTIGKPIWWNSAAWVDVNGTRV